MALAFVNVFDEAINFITFSFNLLSLQFLILLYHNYLYYYKHFLSNFQPENYYDFNTLKSRFLIYS